MRIDITSPPCCVCGSIEPFGPVTNFNARESLVCSGCKASARNRAVYIAVMACYWERREGNVVPTIYEVGGSPLRAWWPTIPWVSEFETREGVDFQDLTHLTYANAAFDLVVCSDVLEHIENYRRAIAELCRVIKPEGYLILTVPPNGNAASEHQMYPEPRPRHTDPVRPEEGCEVFRTYSRMALQDEISQCGMLASSVEFALIGPVFIARKWRIA